MTNDHECVSTFQTLSYRIIFNIINIEYSNHIFNYNSITTIYLHQIGSK